MGFENIFDGSLVAYHYESQTRNEKSNHLESMGYDLNNTLIPFIYDKMIYVKKYIDLVH
jgi:hypothetical protein